MIRRTPPPTAMTQPPNQPAKLPAAEAQPPLRRIPVAELLADAKQVILLHQGQEYHLRLTRAGKLILTK